MVIKRLMPFWKEYFEKIKLMDGCHLIVAHSNSLRAIIKILEIYLRMKLYLSQYSNWCTFSL